MAQKRRDALKFGFPLVIAAVVAFGTAAFGESDLQFNEAPLPLYRSRIAMLDWNRSNLETLRSLDKAALAQFLNDWPENVYNQITPAEIDDFGWFDLAGDGKYELAFTDHGGPCCEFLKIFWQEGPGKFRYVSYRGARYDLKDTVRDLSGDGKKELILHAYVGSASYGGASPSPTYPQVYRLENGKYVEASRDFPNFYNDEVLPDLNKKIAESQNEFPPMHAVQIMERDKVLRMLGHDSTAGLEQAREWATSSNADLIDDASIVLRDIGGHEDEAQAADAALRRIGTAGGKN